MVQIPRITSIDQRTKGLASSFYSFGKQVLGGNRDQRITKNAILTTAKHYFTTIISVTGALVVLLPCNKNESKFFHFHIVFS
ncbi:MAG: hypothetical protein CMH46_03130 [Muricauda sp.]|nr:hypothetical protein [Allomuricauda sp.]